MRSERRRFTAPGGNAGQMTVPFFQRSLSKLKVWDSAVGQVSNLTGQIGNLSYEAAGSRTLI